MVISGYIFDENMKPIIGATVSVTGLESVRTNNQGAFSIYSANPLALMTIEKPGYTTSKIMASAFTSYAQLEWTGELGEVAVNNTYKSGSNTWLWILGLAGAAYAIKAMNKPKKVVV